MARPPADKDADYAAPLRDAQRNLIQRVIALLEITSTELAREATLSPSTLNKFVNSDVAHVLSARTEKKILDAIENLTSARMKGLPADAGQALRKNVRTLLESFRINSTSILNYSERVMIVGTARADHWAVLGYPWPPRWSVADDPEEVNLTELWVPKSLVGAVDSAVHKYALRVKDPSFDRVYKDRSYVVAALYPGNYLLRSGQKVVVRRVRPNDHAEISIKEIQLLNDGNAWLWPRSTSPEYQQPTKIVVSPNADEEADQSVRIVGVVIASMVAEFP